jgi:hypothetical protein
MEYVLESILSLLVPQVGEQGHQILAVEHVHQTLHASHTQVHQIKKTKKLQMYLRKLCYYSYMDEHAQFTISASGSAIH